MPYKLAIIGAAGHVNLVLDELPQFPNVHFSAYAPSFEGEDVSRYEGLQGGISSQKGYSDWRQMLDAEEPDIVIICGRYDLNGPIAIEAARRGIHIISEKPSAQKLEEVDMLRQLVQDHGIVYAIMLPMRYEAAFFTARQLVHRGIIGEPYLISAQKSYQWGHDRPTWYADPNKYGSTMTWVGIHAFDYARWVANVDYTWVCAHHANLVHTERPGCQDVATVMAQLANGGSAVFHLDYLRPAGAPTHGDDRLRIAGSKGVLEVCDRGTRLHLTTQTRDIPSWPSEQPDRTLFSDFVAAVEGQGQLLVPAKEAFDITAFAIKAAQAADGGNMVKV
ncbi:MAG: Gfo/Idh/MocA family oxidoreductase [Chloroflexota bacterium]|nr:Gfo/Idh/MocA family oxidoreductase [Chloroflexota bacterium]